MSMRRSREINIFSTSALDLFASALAAFIVITMIVLPFFLKYDETLMQRVTDLAAQLRQSQADLAQAEAQLSQTESQLSETQAALEQCQQERASTDARLAQCVEDLSSTFLTILIRWGTSSDVDLHVVDPVGNEFYFEMPRFPGAGGELTEDVVDGPGVEVFEEADARTGTFRVLYNLYALRGEPTQVTGSVYSRQGRQSLPPITLDSNGETVGVATISVNADGSVNITAN